MDQTRPKIAICFFGITRALAHSIHSIEDNIYAPARELGEVKIFAHLFRLDRVENPRSGESGEMDPDEYKLLKPDWVTLEEPEKCLEQWGFGTLAAFGDLWNDQQKTNRNLVHQLHSLREVYLAAKEWTPDLYLFVRPDALYLDRFEPEIRSALAADEHALFTPRWGQWDGLNDMFAICRPAAADLYARRVEKALVYNQNPAFKSYPLHSHRLLAFAFKDSPTDFRFMKLRAKRVRLGGKVIPSSFMGPRLFKLIQSGKRLIISGRKL